MPHTILFMNLHSNSISIPCTTKLAFSDSASLLHVVTPNIVQSDSQQVHMREFHQMNCE